MASDMSVCEIIVLVTNTAVELSRAEIGGFFHNRPTQPDSGWELVSLVGGDIEQYRQYGKPQVDGLLHPTFNHGEIIRSDDVTRDPRRSSNLGEMPEGHFPVRSFLSIPIKRRDGTIEGAMLFGHSEIGRFSSHTVLMLSNLATLTAVALDNAERAGRAGQEIAERARAEAKFRDLIEYSPRMKWWRKRDGQQEFYNKAWRDYTGLTSEESANLGFLKVVHPDDQSIVIERRNIGIAAGQPYEMELRFLSKAGEYRWCALKVVPVYSESGTISGWVGSATDVHDLRMARQEADRSRRLLRSILDTLADPVYVKDARGIFVMSNHACDRLVGMPAEGFNDDDFGLDRENLAEIREHDRAVMNGAKLLNIEEVAFDKTFLSSKVPWFDETGEVIGLVGISRDITERKRAEETEKLLLGELNHRVKNTLATIQSMAVQTLRHSPEPEAFKEAFIGRLHAMSLTHNILTQTNWSSALLSDVLTVELTPYHVREDERWEILGPSVHLSPAAATHIGMVIHELTTNAVKYGCLSESGGLLRIDWTMDGETLELVWTEAGGPPVIAPSREGFGTRLFKNIARAFNGSVEFSYDPTGLVCTFSVPYESVMAKPNEYLSPTSGG